MKIKPFLNETYQKFNNKNFLSPDPLEILYDYDKNQQEIVGFIASSLAFGSVKQIIKNIQIALLLMDKNPKNFLQTKTKIEIESTFKNFQYRFIKDAEFTAFLIGIKEILQKHSSIENCFFNHFQKSQNIYNAISSFYDEFISLTDETQIRYILANPHKKSAVKRFNLFLRWMVRCDDIDLGLWTKIKPSSLIIPLDTHMHKIALKLNFTKRKQADMKTAIEITNAFKKLSPNDPVKYDFSLTRYGILKIEI